eukprot:SAG11_NODE_986_length_6284_cov_72.758771_9_plen_74_part_00
MRKAQLKKDSDVMMTNGDYRDAFDTFTMAGSIDPGDDEIPALVLAEREIQADALKKQAEKKFEVTQFESAVQI